MSDLQDKTLKAIQDATQCWQICGPDPGHPPCTCRQARDAAIALVLEEAAQELERLGIHGGAAIRALRDGK